MSCKFPAKCKEKKPHKGKSKCCKKESITVSVPERKQLELITGFTQIAIAPTGVDQNLVASNPLIFNTITHSSVQYTTVQGVIFNLTGIQVNTAASATIFLILAAGLNNTSDAVLGNAAFHILQNGTEIGVLNVPISPFPLSSSYHISIPVVPAAGDIFTVQLTGVIGGGPGLVNIPANNPYGGVIFGLTFSS